MAPYLMIYKVENIQLTQKQAAAEQSMTRTKQARKKDPPTITSPAVPSKNIKTACIYVLIDKRNIP
jgi:hypothetical protein